MSSIKNYFYVLASLSLTVYLIVLSKTFFNPLLAALIVALVLKPLVKSLENLKISRLWSTLITIILFLILFFSIIAFFSTQIRGIDFDFSLWAKKLDGIPLKIQNWLQEIMGVNAEQQSTLLKESFTSLLKNGLGLMNQTLSITTAVLTAFVLFIISLFFFLYYRHLLVSFLFRITKPRYHHRLKRIISKIQIVIKRYTFGLFTIIMLIATLNTLGLFILGIEHALLFGLMAAFLTLIPYIGILIGSLLPMIFALMTKNSFWYPLGVLAVFIFVQFLEGNFLTPNIIGKQVRINPFAAILALIIGGSLLGIIGIMFALPVLAALKVICDEIPCLKAWGYLLDNPMQEKTTNEIKS